MKRYERESLFKNFFVFFSLLEILLTLVFVQYYLAKVKDHKVEIFKSMQVCSYTFECKEFEYDFASKDKHNLNQLYSDSDFYSFFTLAKSKKYDLKISYKKSSFKSDIESLRRDLIYKFLFATFLLFVISIFFTLYSLKPIRKALELNDEFVKDILHDFNTPIATMKLNIKMLNEEYKKDPLIKKLSYSMDTILHLQNNLRSFLFHSPSQKEKFDLIKLIKNRQEMVENIYPNIRFIFNEKRVIEIESNKDALTRVLDNLLSNAAKYNKKDGEVIVEFLDKSIYIKDSGRGIKDLKAVFDRYYKEQSRGLGLGLHIVQKLCDELGVGIKIVSKIDVGTTIELDMSELI